MITAQTPAPLSRWVHCSHCDCRSLRAEVEARSQDDQLRCLCCGAHVGYRKRQLGAFGGFDRKRVASGEG